MFDRFVPDAYREWGLAVRDWKVRTSVALDDGDAVFKTSRMLPSAGCEADDTVAYTEKSRATSYFVTESKETTNFLCAECKPGAWIYTSCGDRVEKSRVDVCGYMLPIDRSSV